MLKLARVGAASMVAGTVRSALLVQRTVTAGEVAIGAAILAMATTVVDTVVALSQPV
jgi:hypothetical protein